MADEERFLNSVCAVDSSGKFVDALTSTQGLSSYQPARLTVKQNRKTKPNQPSRPVPNPAQRNTSR